MTKPLPAYRCTHESNIHRHTPLTEAELILVTLAGIQPDEITSITIDGVLTNVRLFNNL